MAPTVRNGAPDLEKSAIDYEAIKDPGHGNTPAGWTGVFIILVGACIGVFGNVFGNWPVFFAGCAVALAGPVVGLAMRAAGKGKPRK